VQSFPQSSLKPARFVALALTGCLAACSPRETLPEVQVRAVDYAFASPDSLPAGETIFSFANAGTVQHEVKVIALRPGTTLTTILRLEVADSGWRHLTDPTSGILTAGPGATTPGRLLINLQPNRTYLLVCGFQDSEDAKPHIKLGMVREVHVYRRVWQRHASGG
jgi:hypothetical protein